MFCKEEIRLAGNWRELYAQELSEYPKIAELLSDGDRLLDIAGLTRDEREAWKLKGQLSESEIALMLKRQRKTVAALIERAEFKLRGLRESLAEHRLCSGPCRKKECTLLHWFCSCGGWNGSTVLGEEGNRLAWREEHLERSTR